MAHRPRRSILFVGVTGEEAGLAGSDYFVRHPPVAVGKIVAIGGEYSFFKAGIPAVWLISGDKSRDPSIDVRAFRQRWGATIDHTPADDMAQSFNWTSAALFTRIQFLIGYIVGNSTARPSWIGNQPFVR